MSLRLVAVNIEEVSGNINSLKSLWVCAKIRRSSCLAANVLLNITRAIIDLDCRLVSAKVGMSLSHIYVAWINSVVSFVLADGLRALRHRCHRVVRRLSHGVQIGHEVRVSIPVVLHHLKKISVIFVLLSHDESGLRGKPIVFDKAGDRVEVHWHLLVLER